MEGISGLAAVALEMPQDAIHEQGLSYNGDDLHLGATGTEHRVNFEDFAHRRAQVRRLSLMNSEFSSSVEEYAALPEKPCANRAVTLERLL